MQMVGLTFGQHLVICPSHEYFAASVQILSAETSQLEQDFEQYSGKTFITNA